MGKGPSTWRHCWAPAAKARSASPSKGALQSHACGAAPHSDFLALLDTLLMRMPSNCGQKCCKRLCQVFNLPLCVGSDSWPLSPCLTCAPVPPFFLVVGKPKAHFLGSYWHHHSWMPLSSLTTAKALWNSCLVSSGLYQQKQPGTIGRYGWAWDMAVLQETVAADQSCVVSSSCSCLTSLQKHCGTVSDPKAKNAPFNGKWLHQFYLKSQSLLRKQNPKSSGSVLFLVVSFYSFSRKIHIILQCHLLN